ncbi:MAG: type II toxin-antitoxin system Phd/YefM family antitoxin [Aliihoeflea sp.]|uniref:type II toxin-antitoxin system Phd/YefM family antitoxin n=1 Tax=Aliihoeflea sp. TaxID=2608088 RepID=UPI004037F5D2
MAESTKAANHARMKFLSASDAKNHFRQLIDTVQAEPIRIQRYGRDVAIVLSPKEFHRIAEAARGKVNPAVEHLHAKGAKRWASVYAALAK